MADVLIYCDGACSGNPGPGGWGAILKYLDHKKTLSGFEDQTTNNRMELRATIEAFRALLRPCTVTVTSDSQYVIRGMTEWLQGWISKGWRNSRKEPVMNRDLWEELLEVSSGHIVTWVWTKGHAGHPENEECDLLARTAIDTARNSQ